jgi:polyphosphate kinase
MMPPKPTPKTTRSRSSKTSAPRPKIVRDLDNPQYYFNRELSWLEFNRRVLEEAQDATNPLLERLKFLAIVSSNLDEFFEVRVAGLQQQAETHPTRVGPDGLNAQQTLDLIAERVRTITAQQYACYRDEIIPGLAREGIHLLTVYDLDDAARDWTQKYFEDEVFPVLTPLAIDPAHPFPQLLNKSLNLAVRLAVPFTTGSIDGMRHDDQHEAERFGVVQVPRVLPRLVALPRELSPDGAKIYVFLSSIISQYIHQLFPGLEVQGCYAFRVTRNSELYLDEDEADNLLEAMQEQLQRRRRGDAVRLEVQRGCDPSVVEMLLHTFELDPIDLYEADGPVNLPRLMTVYSAEKRRDLKDPPFTPPIVRSLHNIENADDLFGAIRHEDILLHHPYESFQSVDDFVTMAAKDPNVLAIKQTLYRTSGNSPIVRALMKAAENGKQVTALVELKARFDEENNIQWARAMEEAGVHVLYGLVGLKTHCKMCMVVRREHDEHGNHIRRYVHLSTGNYNEVTARIYTDVGLLTSNAEIGEDAAKIFNLLTGMSQFPGLSKLKMAPFGLHGEFMRLIERETAHARKKNRKAPPRIICKMNSLVDHEMIQALYRASQAGVQIDLIIRGICCLRPGIRGVSDNIRVRSVIDRFLEHPRIFYFANNGEEEIYVGSSDWMPRNFFRRIEVVFPVENENLKRRLRDEILEASLRDNVKARIICSDGTYQRATRKDGETPFRSQQVLLAAAQHAQEDGNADFFASRPAAPPLLPSQSTSDGETITPSPLSHYDLVLRPAPQAIPGSGDGRAGTNADPVLQSLAEDTTRTLVTASADDLEGGADQVGVDNREDATVDVTVKSSLKSAGRAGKRTAHSADDGKTGAKTTRTPKAASGSANRTAKKNPKGKR